MPFYFRYILCLYHLSLSSVRHCYRTVEQTNMSGITRRASSSRSQSPAGIQILPRYIWPVGPISRKWTSTVSPSIHQIRDISRTTTWSRPTTRSRFSLHSNNIYIRIRPVSTSMFATTSMTRETDSLVNICR